MIPTPTPSPTDTTPEITPVPDAAVIATQDAQRLTRLERAARAARARTRVIPEDPSAVRARVETFVLQQDPVWARQLTVREARFAVEELDELLDALADAQRAVADGAEPLRRIASDVAARRERLEILGDVGDDPQERQLGLAQLTHGRLRRLVAQVVPGLPAVQDAVALFVQQTLDVLRRAHARQVARELAALQARRDALRVDDAADVEANALLRRMAERVSRALPVTALEWPTSADAFAPPTLVENTRS